jgi:hypothetical protein
MKEMLSRTLNISPLTKDSLIVIGNAYNIQRMAIYIVGGEIIGVQMRENFKLSKSNLDIPDEMITFAKERIKRVYTT